MSGTAPEGGRLDRSFARLAGWAFDHRWVVVAVGAALLAGSLGLASRARVDASYEAFFDDDDTTYQEYAAYREDFGSDEVSYIVYGAPDAEHGVFDLDVMRRVVELTAAFEEEVPFLYEVDSLANAELMVGDEGGIEIRELRDHFPETQEAMLALRERYLAKPMFVGGLVSADGRHGGIVLRMDRASTDALDEIRWDPEGGDGMANLYPQVTNAAIESILARPEYSELVFHHSGDVPLNAAFNELTTEESTFLDVVTALVIAVLLAFFFRSWAGVVAPVAVVQLSVISSVAFIVAMGWSLDLAFAGVPTLMTAIGVAHSVHILSEFRVRFSAGESRREALVHALGLVGTPCLLASSTTAIGFAAMSAGPIESMAHQGLYSAFGVMAAFLLSLTLLLALLSFGREHAREPSRSSGPDDRMARFLAAVGRFACSYPVPIVVAFAAVFAVSVVGILRIQVDSNWFDDFSDRVPLKQATRAIDDIMGGISNLIVLFEVEEDDALKEPAALAEIDRIQHFAADFPIVKKSFSLVDVLKDLNQSFHADAREWHRLPETRQLVAQYLLLYESAGGSEADTYVTSDYRSASLELRIGMASIQEMADFVAALEAELEARPLEHTKLRLTGIGALWLKLMEYIVTSQITGFLLAFSVISLILCALLRSVSTGFIAMLPNLSPVLLTLGCIGWLGLYLDYNKVTIAAVALGIAVDDTIHLMMRIRHEFHRLGRYPAAVDAALQDVGRALFITSVTLVCGFAVLLLSLLDSSATRGLLLGGTIVVALVADFLLMPALVVLWKPFGPERGSLGSRAGGGDPDDLSAAA